MELILTLMKPLKTKYESVSFQLSSRPLAGNFTNKLRQRYKDILPSVKILKFYYRWGRRI